MDSKRHVIGDELPGTRTGGASGAFFTEDLARKNQIAVLGFREENKKIQEFLIHSDKYLKTLNELIATIESILSISDGGGTPGKVVIPHQPEIIFSGQNTIGAITGQIIHAIQKTLGAISIETSDILGVTKPLFEIVNNIKPMEKTYFLNPGEVLP